MSRVANEYSNFPGGGREDSYLRGGNDVRGADFYTEATRIPYVELQGGGRRTTGRRQMRDVFEEPPRRARCRLELDT